MRFMSRPAGPLGLALLAVTALAGVVLAVHGWSGRHSGLPAGALAGGSPSQAASTRPARQGGAASPSAPAASSSAPAATPSGTGASPSGPGPLLSAQSYAQYSFRVWPGTPGPDARAALTGLTVKVVRHGSGITVTAGVVGQPTNAPRFYAHGALVYVVEASMGDDSGNSDYSLGDDGLVVTDARGRILQ
jgi:hypothetical protein